MDIFEMPPLRNVDTKAQVFLIGFTTMFCYCFQLEILKWMQRHCLPFHLQLKSFVHSTGAIPSVAESHGENLLREDEPMETSGRESNCPFHSCFEIIFFTLHELKALKDFVRKGDSFYRLLEAALLMENRLKVLQKYAVLERDADLAVHFKVH